MAIFIELLPYPTLAFTKAANAEAEAYATCAEMIRLLLEATFNAVLTLF